jgi:predicted nucleotidyltransferase
LDPSERAFNISRVAIFTPEERERLRDALVATAKKDDNLCGAAHTGSAAASQLDRWSDIDLALCVKATAFYDQVVAEWAAILYERHHAVAHVDVMRGATLFRVFLLTNTLQVDIAFWRAEDFGAIGPNFQLVFGEAKPPPRPGREGRGSDWHGVALCAARAIQPGARAGAAGGIHAERHAQLRVRTHLPAMRRNRKTRTRSR